MNFENIDLKIKDVIQFFIYIIPAVMLVASLNSKVDNLAISVDELKNDKKEESGESRASNIIIQNDLKALNIRAELNRQNIEIMKADIELLKTQYQRR